ncbi:ABR250Wp [Eremothecium gossypii ATCC 10895]|uniref:ABR250Wp n=1 Tax=Eremothecium gossypii (strain ATCC 10895 / CBS 109.51 / FGSC 9923 / NRRL Y-1056) TaxID=284811 RepID=D8FGA8_EREGS|nr:ABR250Wp [Eremothecium gossypii ATCC 10895]ADJ41751.1 ABR250Wp [Eremothecium gossypii ATCC 10895]
MVLNTMAVVRLLLFAQFCLVLALAAATHTPARDSLTSLITGPQITRRPSVGKKPKFVGHHAHLDKVPARRVIDNNPGFHSALDVAASVDARKEEFHDAPEFISAALSKIPQIDSELRNELSTRAVNLYGHYSSCMPVINVFCQSTNQVSSHKAWHTSSTADTKGGLITSNHANFNFMYSFLPTVAVCCAFLL